MILTFESSLNDCYQPLDVMGSSFRCSPYSPGQSIIHGNILDFIRQVAHFKQSKCQQIQHFI